MNAQNVSAKGIREMSGNARKNAVHVPKVAGSGTKRAGQNVPAKSIRLEAMIENFVAFARAVEETAAGIKAKWDRERKGEAERIKKRKKALRDRLAIAEEESERDRFLKSQALLVEPPAVKRAAVEAPDKLPEFMPRFDPEPEYQPPAEWTTDHVIRRLIAAHTILRGTPAKIRPTGYGSPWPTYRYEMGDLAIQAGAGTFPTERDMPAGIAATSAERLQMDEALRWLPRYVGDPPLAHLADNWLRLAAAAGLEDAQPDNPLIEEAIERVVYGLKREGREVT